MKKKTIIVILFILFIAGFSSCEKKDKEVEEQNEQNVQPSINSFKIYMSTYGNDINNGLDSNHAVITLNKVQEILFDSLPDRDIEIHIRPGNYYNQIVSWTFTNGKKITFTAKDFTKDRPIFDGQGNETWFKLNTANGSNSNLNFRYIKVQNYKTGISFNGNRDNPSNGWNGNNHLYGMYFYNIGNKFTINKKPSTAAVRMVNSQNNSVINCHFVNIENIDSGLAGLHALYIAHYSSHNEIYRNRYENICGVPIKVRDESNYNKIEDNNFIRTGDIAFYQCWYCDPATHLPPDTCTKVGGECPSYGNEFRDNDCNKNYYGNTPNLFKEYGDSTFCGFLPAKRLRTSGNINH